MPHPRAAVIGYGFAGRCFHSYLISLVSNMTLQGVASRSPETRARIEKERDCKAYESFAQVLADDEVDVVVLASPSHVHAEQAVAALEAGKHVVTDKPMALTLAEGDRMIAAAKKADRMLSVFHNRRWDGDYHTVRQLMEEDKLGELRRVEMAWGGFGMGGGWRGKRAMGGGRVYDLGAHMIDQLCHLFAGHTITSVYARLQYEQPRDRRNADSDVESDAVIVVGFDHGATGVIDTSHLTAIPKPRFYVAGTGGTFVKFGLDPQEAAMIKGDIDAAMEDPALFGRFHNGSEETTIPTRAGRWRSYFENIADYLNGDAELAVKPESVRPCMAVIDAAFESARTGKLIKTSIDLSSL